MKRALLILIAVILLTCAGCTIRPAGEKRPQDQVTEEIKTVRYGYRIYNFDYVDTEIRYYLNKFGEPELLEPANADVKIYTDIPQQENNAKGTGLLGIIMPNADPTTYHGVAGNFTESNGLTVTTYYRTIEGILTDEYVNVYVDSLGNIRKYETANWGQYNFTESEQREIIKFKNYLNERIDTKLPAIIFEVMSPTTQSAPSNYSLITDKAGNLVIYTTAILKTDLQYLKVDLYAIIE